MAAHVLGGMNGTVESNGGSWRKGDKKDSAMMPWILAAANAHLSAVVIQYFHADPETQACAGKGASRKKRLKDALPGDAVHTVSIVGDDDAHRVHFSVLK